MGDNGEKKSNLGALDGNDLEMALAEWAGKLGAVERALLYEDSMITHREIAGLTDILHEVKESINVQWRLLNEFKEEDADNLLA
ncbi:MAG: hypothetical protein Kow0025_18350 [Thermodesulfovibrionales bacterium]